jgi:hypothetical protein
MRPRKVPAGMHAQFEIFADRLHRGVLRQGSAWRIRWLE